MLFFKTKQDKMDRFWAWFIKNEQRLFDFEKDQERVFNELSKMLCSVDENLTFEFSSVNDSGKREFVISAAGIRDSFESVEELVDRAPALEKWSIIKFRPRRGVLNELKFQGVTVKPSEVYFAVFEDSDPEKVALMLFIKGYQENDTYGQIGFLILDEVLGEYDVETKVGALKFESTDSEYFVHSSPISELQGFFDRRFSK